MKGIRARFTRVIQPSIPHVWPAALLGLLCAAFFWDVFGLPANRIVGGADLTNLFRHWCQFAVTSLRQGRLPLWNPHLFSGTPFFANPQPALFYPPTWLALLMPINRALSLIIVLHVWLAGLGMYGWMQSEGASRIGALFSGVVFAFSGYVVARIWAGHLGVVTTGSWLPLLLWIYRRIDRDEKWTIAAAGALPVGLAILAGHTASFLYVALALIAYSAFCAWRTWRRTRLAPAVVRRLLLLCVMLLAGLAVAAVQLLPTAQLLAHSTRQAGADYRFAARFSWPPGYLLTLLVPNFFGEPTHTGYWGDGVYEEFIFYVGLLPLLLVVAGFRLRHRLKEFLLVVGLGSLLLAFGQYGVLHRLSYRFLPLFRVTRAPARAGSLFTLAASALAGLVLTTLEKSGREYRLRLLKPFRWSSALAVAGTVLVLITVAFAMFAWGRETAPAAGRLWHQANQATLFVFFFLLSIGLLIEWKKARSTARRFGALALALVVLDLWTFGAPMLEARDVEECAYWRIVAQAVPDPKAARVLPWGLSEFEQNGAMAFGLRSVFGYDPLVIQRYEEFIASRPDPFAQTYDLLNAGYLVTTAPWESAEGAEQPQLVLEESGVHVYKRTKALPPAWIVPLVEVMDGPATLAHIHQPAFDPRQTALIEAPNPCKGTGGTVEITSYEGGRVEAWTEGGGGLLVLSEITYPGWKATVDGERAELLRANYVLQAVCVPPGTRQVVFRYDPPLLRIGLAVSGLALLSIAVASIWGVMARQEERAP